MQPNREMYINDEVKFYPAQLRALKDKKVLHSVDMYARCDTQNA